MLFSFLFGCASNGKKDKDFEMNLKESSVPEWVYEIEQSCEHEVYLCASAEGDSSAAADANSKKSLASILKTKNESNISLEKFGFTAAEAQALELRVQQDVNHSVAEIFKKAYIKSRYEKDGISFSLSVLEKIEAKRRLRGEIKSLDDQIRFHYKKGLKNSLVKMNLLFSKRIYLNKKYMILAGESISTDMSISKINNLKYSKVQKGNKVLVRPINDVPRILVKKVEEILSSRGFKVVRDNATDLTVRLVYSAKDGVQAASRGLKEYSFSLEVDVRDNSGDKVDSFISAAKSSGRNKQDAFLKAKLILIEKINLNGKKLNIK